MVAALLTVGAAAMVAAGPGCGGSRGGTQECPEPCPDGSVCDEQAGACVPVSDAGPPMDAVGDAAPADAGASDAGGAVCGDDACDTAEGEACSSCGDCQPCGACGDGFCFGGETCATCPLDCCP